MTSSTRVVLLVLATLGALLVGWRAWAFRAERERLVAEVVPLLEPASQPGSAATLRRTGDPLERSLTAVRFLLNSALAPPERTGGRARSLRRLELAGRLATAVASHYPASWEAAYQQGAATYLLRSSRRDNTLLTEPGAWEGPLRRALELAPARTEPPRFLGLAYLELWGFLPEAKRREARRLVGLALADPASFDRVIGPWLAVAPDFEAALAAMPAEAEAWAKVRRRFAERLDWPAVCRAHQEARRRRLGQMEEDLAHAAKEQAGKIALGVLRSLPVERESLPVFLRAMADLPAGLVDRQTATQLEAWLRWNLEGCLEGPCPLPAPVAGRLAFVTTPRTGPGDGPLSARAALAAGDKVAAERELRRARDPGDARWFRYRLAEARNLVERGKTSEARQALATIREPNDELDRLLLWDLAHQLGRVDAPPVPSGWRMVDGRSLRWVPLEDPAPGLVVALAQAPPDGAALEVRLDGQPVACVALAGNASALRLPGPIAAGAHRLEIETLASVAAAQPVPLSVTPLAPTSR